MEPRPRLHVGGSSRLRGFVNPPQPYRCRHTASTTLLPCHRHPSSAAALPLPVCLRGSALEGRLWRSASAIPTSAVPTPTIPPPSPQPPSHLSRCPTSTAPPPLHRLMCRAPCPSLRLCRSASASGFLPLLSRHRLRGPGFAVLPPLLCKSASEAPLPRLHLHRSVSSKLPVPQLRCLRRLRHSASAAPPPPLGLRCPASPALPPLSRLCRFVSGTPLSRIRLCQPRLRHSVDPPPKPPPLSGRRTSRCRRSRCSTRYRRLPSHSRRRCSHRGTRCRCRWCHQRRHPSRCRSALPPRLCHNRFTAIAALQPRLRRPTFAALWICLHGSAATAQLPRLR